MATSSAQPVEALSFEAAMAELETIVRELEAGKTGLEDSIKAYERGVALRTHCDKKLKEAQMRISQIATATDGTLKTIPFTEQD